MNHPYREMTPTVIPPEPKLRCCNCGCLVDDHHFFNSEFVECLGKGRPKVPPPPAPFLPATCTCDRLQLEPLGLAP